VLLCRLDRVLVSYTDDSIFEKTFNVADLMGCDVRHGEPMDLLNEVGVNSATERYYTGTSINILARFLLHTFGQRALVKHIVLGGYVRVVAKKER
jgi:hypothetical protein